MQVLHRVSSSLSGPVDPSFRALSGRLEFTVRRHKFNKDSLLLQYHVSRPGLASGVFELRASLSLDAASASKVDDAVREIGLVLPNNQRQHRTLHIQKDVLPLVTVPRVSRSCEHFRYPGWHRACSSCAPRSPSTQPAPAKSTTRSPTLETTLGQMAPPKSGRV